MMDHATMSAATTTSTPPSAAASQPQVRVEIRSNPLYLSGVRELVAAVSRRLGFTEESGGQIALAVDEALCNVIRHGYGKRSDRPIWLSIWPEGGAWAGGGGVPTSAGVPGDEKADAIRIVIEDEAQQVDPSVIKSRDLEEVRPGGLGVHIIKTVMDEAVYERRPVAGMRLTMVKRRASAAGGSGAASRCGCGAGRQGCSGAGGTEAGHG
jgi:anti-sigma regulatory factor (Ser/Thr protein kinase)